MKDGAIALVTLLFIGSILTVTGVTLVLVNVDLNKTTKNFYSYELSKFRGQSCSEDALLKVNQNFSYTGNGSITFADGSCTYTITNDPVNSAIKVIAIVSIVNDYYYKLTIRADTSSGNIVIL
jgi:hypothetical protein